MSLVDDFIYKVKTGRLFSGSKSKLEMLEEQINQHIETMNAKIEELAETNTKGISGLETKVGELEETNKGLSTLESKLEVLEAMDKEIMVLETKIESWGEKNREVLDPEPQPEMPEEITGEVLPEESQKENVPITIRRTVKKQIGPDVVIHFIFMNKTYIVENFNLNFKQDINTYKNRPDSFTYGGTMQITLSGFLDPSLDEWLTQTYQTREGEIHFFPNMPKITDSALLTIFFADAYCTACNKTIDAVTSGVLTTLTVSPRRIKIGNEEFENKWKQKEPLEFTIKSV